MERYALRHFGQVEILSDFDEYYQHFQNHHVEFPISQVVQGNIDFHRVREYQVSNHFHFEREAVRVDQYINNGQVGAMGANASSDDNVFTEAEK